MLTRRDMMAMNEGERRAEVWLLDGWADMVMWLLVPDIQHGESRGEIRRGTRLGVKNGVKTRNDD